MKTFLVSIVLLSALATAQSAPVTYATTSTGILLTNTSNQPIISVIVDVTGSQSKTIYKHDWFTKSVQFDAGTTLDFLADPGKVEIVWCQFADGSQWGDQSRGQLVLTNRSAAMTMFTQLQAANDTTFTSILANALSTSKGHGSIALTARNLQDTVTSNGISSARKMVAERLQNAAARKAAGSF